MTFRVDQRVPTPVIVVSSDTAQFIPASRALAIVETTTVRNVIDRRGKLPERAAEIVILDLRAAGRTDVIVAGLLLRNAGRTVVVTDPTTVPVELVNRLYEFTIQEKRAGRSVRTELLLMEEAMRLFGEIGDVVAYFEREFLG